MVGPQTKTRGILEVNGAQLYHEVRGSGPSVLFISGATGDAGHFERVAEVLSGEFTVVTYDRRANSRSPRPYSWEKTSIDEQADDAAGLIEALELVPAAVFGTSGGAIIGLNLVIRHPGVVRGAILHEPAMMSAMARPEEVMGTVQEIIEGGMAKGGPRAAVEAFVRFAAGSGNFEKLSPELRERMLGNGETLFGTELGVFESYQPDDDTLAAVEVPVQVMVGTDSAPFFGEAARWLAARLGVEVRTLPGGHAPYFDRPEEMAEAVRPFLSRVGRSVVYRFRKEQAMSRKILPHEVRGKGEPIVLVPGGLSGWFSWIPHAERLSTERMVIRIQLRSIELAEAGEPFPADYGPLTEVDALHATVNELSLESFDLVGWSYGGLVALAFALGYPERIRTLTIIEPDAYWILRETGHAARALAESERVSRSLAGQEVTVDDLKQFLVQAGLGKPGYDFESLPQWPVWVQNRQVLSVIGTTYDYNDSLERLRALEVPILAVKGTEGSEDSTTIVDDLVANTPHSRSLELPGGHACHIENIDRFLKELTRHTVTAV